MAATTRTAPALAVAGAGNLLETIPPSSIKRGVRLFVFLLVKVLKTYTKYETVINPVLPGGVATALATLIAELADVQLLNKPGPE